MCLDLIKPKIKLLLCVQPFAKSEPTAAAMAGRCIGRQGMYVGKHGKRPHAAASSGRQRSVDWVSAGRLRVRYLFRKTECPHSHAQHRGQKVPCDSPKQPTRCLRRGFKCVTNAIDRLEFNNATPNPAILKNHRTHPCIFPMYSPLLTPETRKTDELF